MSRAVCGICWCPYDDDGQCGCEHTPMVRDDTALLRQCLEALNRSDYLGWQLQIPLIKALKERLK